MKNYISQIGFQKLVDEHNQLLKIERPKTCEIIAWAAGNGDRSENADYLYGKKRLREIDKRLRFLNQRISTAQVVDYEKIHGETIRFGATVTIENEEREKTITIVGSDEINTEKGHLSYLSPVGKALMGKTTGDEITIHSPSAKENWTITAVHYKKWE